MSCDFVSFFSYINPKLDFINCAKSIINGKFVRNYDKPLASLSFNKLMFFCLCCMIFK